MTTIKAILNAKASGDDSGYKYQLSQIHKLADELDKAEAKVAELSKQFRKASDLVTELTGLELWHGDDGKTEFFYFQPKHELGRSINYPTRATAIHAAMTDKIEWA